VIAPATDCELACPLIVVLFTVSVNGAVDVHDPPLFCPSKKAQNTKSPLMVVVTAGQLNVVPDVIDPKAARFPLVS
jgi:hypothetical protein